MDFVERVESYRTQFEALYRALFSFAREAEGRSVDEGRGMPDLTVTRNGELMVSQVEGENDEAVEFLDGYMPPEGVEYTVVDSGRLIFPEAAIPGVLDAAKRSGLTWEQVEQV